MSVLPEPCLLTGVSKFSKVSLFSGLNNLDDITVDARYSAICGYTDEDVDQVFAPELPGLDRDEIRRWYNGYNPFDLLCQAGYLTLRGVKQILPGKWIYTLGHPNREVLAPA